MTSPQIRILVTAAALLLAGGTATMVTQMSTIPTQVTPLERSMGTAFGPGEFSEAEFLREKADEHRFAAAGGALVATVGAISGLLALAASSIPRTAAREEDAVSA